MANAVSGREQLVTSIARRDFPLLSDDMTVGEALASIRQRGVGERIVYFYVAGESGRLAGVIPTRRLLTASLEQPLRDIMIGRVVTIPEQATVQQACEQLVMHRFLALPVVDRDGRIVGVVDVDQFTDEVFDLAARQQADAVFEALGIRLHEVRDASPLRAFRLRFPWLLATIAGGTLCALMLGASEATLSQSLVLAFFLALVLGLGESVAVQSMTVTIQALRGRPPSRRWYAHALARELGTAILLGLGCGLLVTSIAFLWRREPAASLAIGLGIGGSLVAASLIGLTVPWLFHTWRLDPKIAAGPIALALADVCTVALYLSAATILF